MSLLFCLCVFCDSFLCSISLLLLSDSLSCVLNSVLIVHVCVGAWSMAVVLWQQFEYYYY